MSLAVAKNIASFLGKKNIPQLGGLIRDDSLLQNYILSFWLKEDSERGLYWHNTLNTSYLIQGML